MGKIIPNSKIAVLGASYREDVGDTRYRGSEIIVRKLSEMGENEHSNSWFNQPL
jgi:UDP-N-acetyl-D-glucosamine dehydrogenase